MVQQPSQNCLNTPRAPFFAVVRAFDREGKIKRSQHDTRSDKIQTPRFVNSFKSSIKANPTTPILSIAKDGGLNIFFIWKAIKDDLGYVSRARGVKHLLTDKNKAVRVVKGNKISKP